MEHVQACDNGAATVSGVHELAPMPHVFQIVSQNHQPSVLPSTPQQSPLAVKGRCKTRGHRHHHIAYLPQYGSRSSSTPSTPSLPDDGVANFVSKLYALVNDPATKPFVDWNEDNTSDYSFIVYDPDEFSALVLPRYFKHSNFNSFVRQLNFYGFHKADTRNGLLFSHEFFRKNCAHLLSKIQRRRSIPRKPGCIDSLSSTQLISAACDSAATSSPSSSTELKASPNSTDILSEGVCAVPESMPTEMSSSSSSSSNVDSSSLYLSLHDEISKLRQQSLETQATVIELKQFLVASRSREELLEVRLKQILHYLCAFGQHMYQSPTETPSVIPSMATPENQGFLPLTPTQNATNMHEQQSWPIY